MTDRRSAGEAGVTPALTRNREAFAEPDHLPIDRAHIYPSWNADEPAGISHPDLPISTGRRYP